MTIALVLLCVVVGALELYAARQAKYQTEAFLSRVKELHSLVRRQNQTLESTGRQLNDELGEVRQRLPGLDLRVNQHGGRIDELAALLHRTEEYIRAQAIRLHELEKQRDALAELRGRLADMENASFPVAVPAIAGQVAPDARVEAALTRISDLEHNRAQMLGLQRDLSRALEDVEDVVTDLMRHTSGELDRAITATLEPGTEPVTTVGGSLMCADPALRDVLADVYERCVEGSGLSVRFKTAEEHLTRYYLTGRVLEELGGGYTALLISLTMDVGSPSLRRRLPSDEASVKALLRALHESAGAVARIGPLVAAGTPDSLVAAVLTHAQSLEFDRQDFPADPAGTAARLRSLPVHQLWDLTAWAGRPAAG
ncbi:hypothetical protein [Actinocorallia populi]|uniref:hypothetical protein n=1 Tax=Actinocorallia populi TaxID=2079200 RepID=UPI000D08B90B|nr:hypothetical protein [Actinocorallia populi]